MRRKIDPVTVYQGKDSRVYIEEVYNSGKKTRLFFVKDSDVDGVYFIGLIKWDGAWRQYIFEPEANTKWSAGCLAEIAMFCNIMTRDEKRKWKRKDAKRQESATVTKKKTKSAQTMPKRD